MADTRLDLAANKAVAELEAMRELRPCTTFEPVSRLLSAWCVCGWPEDDHREAA